jgi:polysaccharide export outer membrane protein
MRVSRLSLLLVAVAALTLAGCFGRGPQYAQYVPPPQAAAAGPAVYAVQSPAPAPRGFFAFNLGGPYVRAPVAAAPACGPQGCGAAVASSSYGYAAYPQPEMPYLLDAGDRLRITVFGQDGLTNAYAVDAAGNITMPLVGTVPARGMTTQQLSSLLSERLKQGYIREPKVAIEVEAYRPFFIHGEVATPGQYAYVANMTVENAIAIAGGFGPRADRGKVTVSRTIGGQTSRASVGLNYPLRPGDTLRIGERWF